MQNEDETNVLMNRKKEILRTYKIFFIVTAIGGLIFFSMNKDAELYEKIRSIFVLISTLTLLYYFLIFVSTKLKKEKYTTFAIVFVTCAVSLLTSILSNEHTVFSPINWLPSLFILVFANYKINATLFFLGFQALTIIYYAFFSANQVIYFQTSHYLSSLTSLSVLAIIAHHTTKVFNRYENALVDKLKIVQQSNEELRALNEEYYATQEEIFEQYDYIKNLLQKVDLHSEQVEAILNVTEDALIDYNLTQNQFNLSEKFKQIFDIPEYTENQMPKFLDLIHENSKTIFIETWSNLTEGHLTLTNIDVELAHPSVDMQFMQITFLKYTSEIDKAEHIVISLKNITDRKSKELKINKLAYFDELTGLKNRKGMEVELSEFLKNKPKNSYYFILINISEFHTINNIMGYEIGDKVLIEIAQRIRKEGDQIVTPSRIDSDTFAFIVHRSTNLVSLKQKLETIIILPKTQLSIQLNLGATVYPEYGLSYYDLIRQAEMALAESKRHPNVKYYVYNHTIVDPVERRLDLLNALNSPLLYSEITTEFQPIVDSQTERVIGFECLARWHSSKFGKVSPAEFIPLAEQSALVHQICKKIINEACEFCMKMGHKRTEFVYSINLSPVQLKQTNLAREIINLIDHYGLPHSCFAFEVTESLFIDDFSTAIKQLNLLKQEGFSIYLDDFGTGYSSLNYLAKLPIDVLKVDKSFIDEIQNDTRKYNLLKAFVDIGSSLNIKIIVEGIENQHQLVMVNHYQVYLIQGYFYSKPLSCDDAMAYVEAHNSCLEIM